MFTQKKFSMLFQFHEFITRLVIIITSQHTRGSSKLIQVCLKLLGNRELIVSNFFFIINARWRRHKCVANLLEKPCDVKIIDSSCCRMNGLALRWRHLSRCKRYRETEIIQRKYEKRQLIVVLSESLKNGSKIVDDAREPCASEWLSTLSAISTRLTNAN